jgi:hypothetical protein
MLWETVSTWLRSLEPSVRGGVPTQINVTSVFLTACSMSVVVEILSLFFSNVVSPVQKWAYYGLYDKFRHPDRLK